MLFRSEFVGKNYFEIKNHKLNPQDGLYFNGNGCLVNRVEGNKIFPNKMDGIKKDLMVFRNCDCEFEKTLKNSKTKRKIQTNITIFDNKIEIIDENDNKASIEISSNEIAQNPEKIKATFEKQFSKTGESDFFCEKIAFQSNNLPFLPVSEINELRRNLFEKLMNERIKNYPKNVQKPLKYADICAS